MDASRGKYALDNEDRVTLRANRIEPHANLDTDSRSAKAQKIGEIMAQQRELRGSRVLEIGTGSGIIAAHLARMVGTDGEVVAVDVVDQLQIRNGFSFLKISGTKLPFDDESFDIVISNHVVEHVGERNDQLQHLRELRRVLKKDGCGYTAAPNRWAIVEPHFRLPFLSWLPNHRLKSAYVRLAHRGGDYDCEPLSYGSFASMLKAAGLTYVDHTVTAMRLMKKIESPDFLQSTLLATPTAIIRLLRPIIPTIVFVVGRDDRDASLNPESGSGHAKGGLARRIWATLHRRKRAGR